MVGDDNAVNPRPGASFGIRFRHNAFDKERQRRMTFQLRQLFLRLGPNPLAGASHVNERRSIQIHTDCNRTSGSGFLHFLQNRLIIPGLQDGNTLTAGQAHCLQAAVKYAGVRAISGHAQCARLATAVHNGCCILGLR